VERLAQAQAHTEERVTRLEEGQAALQQGQVALQAAVERLAQVQAETVKSLQRLKEQVGGLSDTVGGDIEDIAYIVLHDVLRREFGWQVGVLERSWQRWGRQLEEIDVFGRATDPANPARVIWIVGEAKHNLTIKEVKNFIGQVERARRYLIGEIFPVCFCYRARPEVQEMITKAGLRLVFSYGKLI